MLQALFKERTKVNIAQTTRGNKRVITCTSSKYGTVIITVDETENFYELDISQWNGRLVELTFPHFDYLSTLIEESIRHGPVFNYEAFIYATQAEWNIIRPTSSPKGWSR